MSRDFHYKPFDEETKLKLELFSNYIRDWLPVFIRASKHYKVINIFDFFAGPGKDSEGTYGSPLIILRELLKYSNDIKEKNIVVNLILNEKAASKFNQLKTEIEKFKKLPIKIVFENLEFLVCYKKHKQLLGVRNSANLLLFDQTGIRHINKEIFLELINYKTTDFFVFHIFFDSI